MNNNQNNNYNNHNMNNYPNNGYNPNMNYNNQMNNYPNNGYNPNMNYNNQQYNNYNQMNNMQNPNSINYNNTLNNNFNPNVVTQPKKKKKHGFLKFLLIVILLFVGFRTYKWVSSLIKEKKLNEELAKATRTLSPDCLPKISDEDLNIDLNDEGMSVKQKIDLGLNPLTKDTDGDGLTDVEELNTYHSDPKKYSTSGDLLSDAYKIKYNYEINKKYDIVPETSVNVENMKLIVKKAEDIEAVYEEFDGTIPSNFYPVIKPFRIHSFTGSVTLKIDNPKDYVVYSYNILSKEKTKLKSTIKNDIITFDVPNNDVLIVSYKDNLIKSKIESGDLIPTFNNEKEYEYAVILMPFLNVLFKTPIQVFQIDDGISEIGNNIALENELNKVGDDYLSIKVSKINSLTVKLLDKVFGKLYDNININEENKSFFSYLFEYRHFKSNSELFDYFNIKKSIEIAKEQKEIEDKKANEIVSFEDQKWLNTDCDYCADSGFRQKENAFPFKNLGTNESDEGVCAGIAYVTAKIFNDNKNHLLYNQIPHKTGEYDLSGEDYRMIWSGKLHDYQPRSNELKAYLVESGDLDYKYQEEPILYPDRMDKVDGELVKLLNYYYLKVNHILAPTYNYQIIKTGVTSTTVKLSEETIQKVKEQLSDGNILFAFVSYDMNHAFNIYRMTEDKNDKNILYLKVYDNNFPDDYVKWNNGLGRVDASIVLLRSFKYNVKDNTKETYYEYIYNPFKPLTTGANYQFNSNTKPYGNLFLYDEELNRL